MVFGLLLYFLPDQNRPTFLSSKRASARSGRNRQSITIHFVESNLVRARPRFVPRNIHVIDYLFTVYRIRPCIGEHAPLEFYFLLVRWNQVAWFWTIFHNEDQIHSAI